MSLPHRPVAPGRHAVRALLSLVLATVIVLLVPSGASAAPPTSPLTLDPADAAAGWLTGEFVDGNHIATDFGGTLYDDHGLTADAILAFAAAGSAGDAAAAAADWLALPAQLTTYAGDGAAESYAGSLAKLILVADILGRDPQAFGGRDLVAELAAREAASGRYADASAFGDFSNGITQALAIIALDRATTDGAPVPAIDYLAAQQCADGGFNSVLEQAGCEGEVDTTAFALEALSVAGRDAEAADALAFLLAEQAADGSFAAPGFGTPPVTTPNSNSTGLAAQALRFAGETSATDSAVAWLQLRQVGLSGPVEDQGAVAYDTAPFNRGNGVRATTQAVLGLAGGGFSALVAPVEAAAYGLGEPAVAPPPPSAPIPAPAPVPAPGGGLPDAAAAPELAATGVSTGGLLELGAGMVALGMACTMVAARRGRVEV